MSTLTLSGWTQPADALNRALGLEATTFDYSAHSSADAMFEALKPLRDVEHVVAWSLGGQLAVRAIAAGALAPKHLTLIAPPAKFVQSPHGMDTLTFDRFRTNYAADPARTKQRFHALVAKGDRDMRRVLEGLEHHPEVENTARWLPWLDELGRVSLSAQELQNLPPTLLVHGASDAIVPLAQSEIFSSMPNVKFDAWEGVAHAPHVHDAARLNAAIAQHRGQT